MEWNPDQYKTSWLRAYLALALQCNLNVLDAVYWRSPWNPEAVEEHLNSQLDKNPISHIEFRSYVHVESRQHLMWVIVVNLDYLTDSWSLIAPYAWMHPCDWTHVV
jgi:hypothetical protein